MQKSHALRGWSTLAFAVAVLAFGASAAAQNHYPLELTNIKPVGSAPNGLDADNRIYRAYPGLTYNIRAAVIGGMYPYTFALANAPSGMTISARGEINWPNPSASASPTITVVDSLGANVSATWTIAVNAAGFKFVDAANGRNAANNGCSSSCGTGTQSNPWRSLKDAFQNASANDITYFRSGSYNILDIPSVGPGSDWEHVEFNEAVRSAIWLEYPGDAAIINFGYQAGAEWGPLIRLVGENIYIDGFETVNSHIMAFQIAPSSRGATFRRMYMHNHGPGQDGSNAAFIMSMSNYPSTAVGMVIQDNTFANAQTCTIKLYSQNKPLLEDNVHLSSQAGPELKADVRRFTVRGDRYSDIAGVAIGGNMHGSVGSPDTPTTGGEIYFNNVRSNDTAIEVNQDGMAVAIYMYRNTFVGSVRVRNTDGSDGPFHFAQNVIVNDDSGVPSGSHITHENVSSPSRVTQSNNLAGSPSQNIVDGNGLLTPAFLQYLGTRGHQISGGGGTTLPPLPPTNVRIIR